MATNARLPRGIAKTPEGWRISVQVNGVPWRRRFPASVPLDDVLKELLAARTERKATTPRLPRGTLKGDVTRYMTDFFAGRSPAAREERQRHLDLWIEALGAETWRSRITRDDISRVLQRWRGAGLSADTCNKRRTALLALYHALDGRGGSNPVREVPKFRPPDPLPRALDYRLIERALKQLPRKTRARLKVIAYTGIRPVQLRTLEPTDWDVKHKLLTVPGTSKGRGTKPYTIPLTKQAEAALREFDRADAWGTFTAAPMARMWKAAAIKVGLSEDSTPYWLRHSFGTRIYQKTGNLKATKDLLGHSSIRMTERYTLAAVSHQQRTAVRSAFR